MEIVSGNLEALLETLPRVRLQWLDLPDAPHQGAPQARLAGSRRLLGLREAALKSLGPMKSSHSEDHRVSQQAVSSEAS